MSDEPQASDEHLHEIAKKIRQLARQTRVPEAREELFDLADQLDRRAELGKKIRGDTGWTPRPSKELNQDA